MAFAYVLQTTDRREDSAEYNDLDRRMRIFARHVNIPEKCDTRIVAFSGLYRNGDQHHVDLVPITWWPAGGLRIAHHAHEPVREVLVFERIPTVLIEDTLFSLYHSIREYALTYAGQDAAFKDMVERVIAARRRDPIDL